jgi:hypothetical protein
MFSAATKTGSQPSAAANYIDDVFSTYLYTGNGSTQTINNGIDLAGEGGLVWTKWRGGVYGAIGHGFWDTNRGVRKLLASNSANAEAVYTTDGVTAFNTNGFSVSSTVPETYAANGDVGTNYCSWTFREQPKFFDVVTYTGNGTDPRNISHNLGSVPGMIIVKRTDTAGFDWIVYHRSVTNGVLYLNSTSSTILRTDYIFQNPTSAYFQVSDTSNVNASGGTYVAYLFAHDAGGFGTSGTDNVISCGSYTGTGSAGNTVNLGYEPQYLMVKRSSGIGDWIIVDTMRSFSETSNLQLFAQSASAEDTPLFFTPTATGFKLPTTSAFANGSGSTYIYMAIRRPMKVPTVATTVFNPVFASSSGDFTSNAGFPIDTVFYGDKSSTDKWYWFDRLRGNAYLQPNTTGAEGAYTVNFASNTSFSIPAISGNFSTYITYNFSRRPGFFDEVCYTGTGTARTVAHNLTVAPELMIVKNRNVGGDWWTYNATLGNTKYLYLNATQEVRNDGGTIWNSTTPTASVFSITGDAAVNGSGDTYVAYLFATCAGVSKVGSYTGNGGTQAIACGFTGGARFVLIKRTNAVGGWYVYDTARGMTLLTDPYLFMNNTAAETATLGSVTTTTGGFTVDATILAAINTNAASYIFLAIA